jgi:N utilization substance protein B
MHNKTFARIASIQSLYQYSICNAETNIDDVIEDILLFNEVEKMKKNKYLTMNINFFTEITKLTTSNLDRLDEIIASNISSNWSISSLHLTLLSLIRCAITELLFFKDTPTKVIISEYTNISTMMLSEGEENFVNGIIDNIAKTIR